MEKGKRHGRNARTSDRVPTDAGWTPEDFDLLKELVADSPLASEVRKRQHARRVVEADRQCRRLDAMGSRTSDEERALSSAHSQHLKAMDALMVKPRTVRAGLNLATQRQEEE